MNKRDYYEVLGVSKNATEQEIKSAFRKLSLKYHPDRQAGKSESEKKDAENHFKECAEAYEVLSDKQKRSNYDQFGFDGPQMNGGFDGFDVNDFMRRHSSMFGDFFGGNPFEDFAGHSHFGFSFGGNPRNSRQNGPQPEDGRNVQIAIQISFKEMTTGCTKEFDIDLTDPCPKCNGSGIKDGTEVKTCAHCHGSGMLTKKLQQGFMTQIIQSPCPHCHGQGSTYEECDHCHGNRRISKNKHIKVKIPAGIDNGQKLRVKDMGECGLNGGTNGNLYVIVSVGQSDLFERQGANVKVKMPISPILATLGGQIEVPSPYKYVAVKVPKNCKSGQQIAVNGKGLNGQIQGNLIVEFEIEPLSNLSKDQLKLLEELSSTIQDSNLSETSAIKAKAKNFYN